MKLPVRRSSENTTRQRNCPSKKTRLKIASPRLIATITIQWLVFDHEGEKKEKLLKQHKKH